MHIVLIICAILFGAFWVANAAIMLISPKWWFKIAVFDGIRGNHDRAKIWKCLGTPASKGIGCNFSSRQRMDYVRYNFKLTTTRPPA